LLPQWQRLLLPRQQGKQEGPSILFSLTQERKIEGEKQGSNPDRIIKGPDIKGIQSKRKV
jgi:hypothetical protein